MNHLGGLVSLVYVEWLLRVMFMVDLAMDVACSWWI